MKKLLIAVLLPFLFVACAKEEVTNPPLSTPTCEDTTDDGKFEEFNAPEKALFIPDSLAIPDAEQQGLVDYMFMTSRVLRNNSIIYDPSFVFKANRPMHVSLHLPYYKNTQLVYTWYHQVTDTADSVNLHIYNVRQLNLPDGCYRLYYVFEDSARTEVLTKGHYDLTIRK